MLKRAVTPTIIALAAALALASPSFAQRAPSGDERAAIENHLSGQGYSGWQEIEFDDDRIAVIGARSRDGGVYDLELDASTLEILERVESDDN
ncbi:MAG TPA: PepSY domain-containing protein [Hyphomicrobiaceae bacterium]|nr:PepSY domain-containing protein [Hyphomicrobiaceae bacterium]